MTSWSLALSVNIAIIEASVCARILGHGLGHGCVATSKRLGAGWHHPSAGCMYRLPYKLDYQLGRAFGAGSVHQEASWLVVNQESGLDPVQHRMSFGIQGRAGPGHTIASA